ncbi:SGNH hydrolase-type esterase domain-containing protein [Hypoxylon sp. NC0597]|nr:SGNH hydrolase-type esterase domain-containing protein [Hypoxylon sp. NC0597]
MPTVHSPNENQNTSPEDFHQLLRRHAEYRRRSYNESRVYHIPVLRTNPMRFNVVLLGDSMIERFQTTAQCNNLRPWPSPNMRHSPNTKGIPFSSSTKAHQLDGVFNSGVSGDKYDNILYRLRGDMTQRHGLLGLMEVLEEQDILLWVVHAGTNNLDPTHGLRDGDIADLRLILQTLLRISHPAAHILLTGLFYRSDIRNNLVDDANFKLKSLHELMNNNVGDGRISFLPPPTTLKENFHFADHVHLNQEGYRLWISELWPRMSEILAAIYNDD